MFKQDLKVITAVCTVHRVQGIKEFQVRYFNESGNHYRRYLTIATKRLIQVHTSTFLQLPYRQIIGEWGRGIPSTMTTSDRRINYDYTLTYKIY